ncbi:MAG: DUF1697 domain-containing protein [Patescibacteria group bacterium]
MKYVALLRGINVGGNNKVEMSRLKKLFESMGYTNVLTYINSGNIIFETKGTTEALAKTIDAAIEKEFKIPVTVVVRTQKEIEKLDDAVPATWVNDESMKTDIMFLWKEFDSKDVVKQLTIKPDIDDVKYLPGAIVWRVDKNKVTKSGLMKIVGTELYKKMTIRNVNTLHKLKMLMEDK